MRSVKRAAVFATFFGLWALSAACTSRSPEESVAAAQRYIASGELNSAVIELKNALQEQPDLAAARYELGTVYLLLGDPESARKELNRALDLGYDRTKVLPPLLQA